MSSSTNPYQFLEKKSSEMDKETFNAVNPVIGLRVYPNGTTEVLRKSLMQARPVRGDRGKIKTFSKVSRERLALTVIESPIQFVTMMTLTYGPQFPSDGKEAKKHLSSFLRKMKRVFGGFDYVWFCEFTARGRVHFHLLTDLPGGDAYDRRVFSAIWCEASGVENYKYSRLSDQRVRVVAEDVFKVHSHQKAWEIIREPDGAARYALKYALKMEQKIVPKYYRNMGRFWGTSRSVKASKHRAVMCNEDVLRQFLRVHCPRAADWDVLPKIIYGCFDGPPKA